MLLSCHFFVHCVYRVEMKFDPNGRPYYVDHNTRTTSWTRPTPLPSGSVWGLPLSVSSSAPPGPHHVAKIVCYFLSNLWEFDWHNKLLCMNFNFCCIKSAAAASLSAYKFFFSGLHHYECVVPLVANILQSCRFWASSTASVHDSPWESRSFCTVFIQVILVVSSNTQKARKSRSALRLHCRPFGRYARIGLDAMPG